MAAPIKQLTPYTCVLANIESLANEIGKPIGQLEIIEKFPHECNKGESIEGAVNLVHLKTLLVGLGLASDLIQGRGRDFLLAHQTSLQDGMFLNSTLAEDGKTPLYHFWRIHEFLNDGVSVVESLQHVPYSYMVFPWDYLEHRGCIAHVCRP